MAKCLDKTCRPLAVHSLVEGFMCVGKLSKPTDHIIAGVNDLSLCFRQGSKLDRWHLNRDDIVMFYRLLTEAMQADEEDSDAVHQTRAEGEPGPGD